MDSNINDPNYLLDEVLKYFVDLYEDPDVIESWQKPFDTKEEYIFERVFKRKINPLYEFEDEIIKLIIRKLVNDGYVSEVNFSFASYSGVRHNITFEGLFFYKQKGYQKEYIDIALEQEMLKSENRITKLNMIITSFGSVIAGITGVLLIIWEIIKKIKGI